MNVVAKAIGTLQSTLPAGLYRIRIRVGSATAEQLVALDGDKEVNFDPVPFVSAIPLQGTEKTHPYHMAAAAAAAAGPAQKTLGNGASIMVFAREWSADGTLSSGNPAAGLSLLDSSENLLAEIGNEVEPRPDGDVSAGWRADVWPGGYILRLELDDPNKTVLLRPIYVSPGHQLQVFCLVGDHVVEDSAGGAVSTTTHRTIRRADLAGAALAISPDFADAGFDPGDRRTRMSELGCIALTQSRQLFSQSLVDELVSENFDNPLLGLYAACLLLNERPNEKAQFRTILDHLLPLLGPDHPDLQALWWQRDDNSQIGDGRLHVLPMLRTSWNLAVDRSIRTLDVFSLGTFYNKLPRIIPSAPWLMLMDNDWAASDDAIDDYIRARTHAEVTRMQARAALAAEAFRKQYVKRAYSAVRRLLPTSLASYLPDLSLTSQQQPTASGAPMQAPAPQGDGPPIAAAEKADLARSLAIPPDLLDQILKRKGH
jgi:hypothetical protein